MAATDKLLGTWKADIERWKELDSELPALGPNILRQLLGTLEVVFTADSLAIKNYGGKQNTKEGTYTAREEGNKIILDVVMTRSGREGVYEIEFIDDDHVNMILTHPKHDAMALKRG